VIRSDSTDEVFMPQYVDVDEWRDKPVRHRYVHCGPPAPRPGFRSSCPRLQNLARVRVLVGEPEAG
jgi:hypothetical protein